VNTSEIIAPRGEKERIGEREKTRDERTAKKRKKVPIARREGDREGCNQMLDRPLPLYLFVPQTASFPGYTLITRDEIDGFAATDTVVLTLRF